MSGTTGASAGKIGGRLSVGNRAQGSLANMPRVKVAAVANHTIKRNVADGLETSDLRKLAEAAAQTAEVVEAAAIVAQSSSKKMSRIVRNAASRAKALADDIQMKTNDASNPSEPRSQKKLDKKKQMRAIREAEGNGPIPFPKKTRLVPESEAEKSQLSQL